MTQLKSFPPLVGARPRVLVLGTMPGAASLAAFEYYAHPRNQFWPIMGALFRAGPELPYARRVRRLTGAGVAVWDVLRHCVRPGSLDGAIVRDSEVANDIPALLRRHPGIRALVFNGGASEQLYRRHLAALVYQLAPELVLLRLPSTSPAHAGRNPAQKLAAWGALLEHLR